MNEPLLQFSVRCRQTQNGFDQQGQSAKVLDVGRAVFIVRQDMRTAPCCVSAAYGKTQKDADRLRQSAKPNQVELRGAICVFPEDMQLSLCGISSPDVGKQRKVLTNTAEYIGGTALFFGDRFVCPRACNLKIRTRPCSYITC